MYKNIKIPTKTLATCIKNVNVVNTSFKFGIGIIQEASFSSIYNHRYNSNISYNDSSRAMINQKKVTTQLHSQKNHCCLYCIYYPLYTLYIIQKTRASGFPCYLWHRLVAIASRGKSYLYLF